MLKNNNHSRPIKVCTVIGTRPEAIKMAPVVQALRRQSWAKVMVLATAQHREMLDQVFSLFNLRAERDLDVMVQNQTLSDLTARLIVSLDAALSEMQPDVVLAQGDTTTVLCCALASFYQGIAFGHVEAGLRTGDLYNPFPEEMNRVVASRLARFHFAPTERSRQNLLNEGIAEDKVFVTGNTVIDALLMVARKDIDIGIELDPTRRMILVTAHRRENFGQPFLEICRAIRRLVEIYPDIEILYPVHPNPNVREVAYRELDNQSRIHLCPPLDYGPFVTAMKKAYLILTDSGGVQEEAPALGKPVIVLRSDTERPEAVDKDVVRMAGTNQDRIVEEAGRLLDDPEHYKGMAKGASPYGDGHAAARIVDILKKFHGR
ncbi:MAG TPA: UDP-N-acetylglucosamine 2-epimerase (non-hydrolyzing) [Desulfobulbaceae bacterium]|nr:UDP-N-acetylglucosamine 2-epimerase (non-hydrolyzing) [Desulfobulbaceae bacterium]